MSVEGSVINGFEPLLKFRPSEKAVSIFAYDRSAGTCGQLIGVGLTVRDAVTNADLEYRQAEFAINYDASGL